MDPLFPEVPADLTGLSREALEALASTLSSRAAILANPEAPGRDELVGTLSIAEVVAAGTAAMDAHDRIVEHLSALDTQAEADAEALSALAARTATASAEADAPEGDEDEPAEDEPAESDAPIEDDPDAAEADAEAQPADAQPEPVTAAGVAAEVVRILAAGAQAATPRRAPARHRARQTEPTGPQSGMTFTATGERVESRDDLARVLSQRVNATVGQGATAGERVTIARLAVDYPEDRQVRGAENEVTATLSRFLSGPATRGPLALTAAGGICAPPEPLYDVETYATDDRPVRASLPSFQAERGGITYRLPLTMGAITGGFGMMTADDDAEFDSGGEPVNTKDCTRFDCPDLVSAEIRALYKCATVGNFGARTWPEDLAHNLDLLSAEWARMGEAYYTTKIKTGSTAVTEAKAAGAWTDIIGAILKARAGMISRHRMRDTQRFRVLLPAWLVEAFPLDGLRGGMDSGHNDLVQSLVASSLERYGVSVSWYKDGVTGGTAQVYGSQGAGALTDFPTSVQWGFFPEGSWFTLDGGVLDLGLVRDSVLNRTNDYQLFMESFEEVAYRGVESLWVTSTVCYSGQVQQAGKVMACAAVAGA